MLIAFILFFVLFVALIILTGMEKLTRFITGDNTNSDGDAVYDTKAITRFLMIIMSVLAVAALLGIVGYVVPSLYVLMFVSPVAFVGVLIFSLIYVNTGNRFRHDSESQEITGK